MSKDEQNGTNGEEGQDIESVLEEVSNRIKRQLSNETVHERIETIGDDEVVLKSDIVNGRKRKRRGMFLASVVVVLILCCIGAVTFVKSRAGKRAAVHLVGEAVYDNLNYEKSNRETIVQTESKEQVEEQKNINVALIGSQSGNSDTMLIATIDPNQKELRLTSMMRDIYVEIPNHQNAKLNAAYQKGGVNLFYETMQKNFDVTLDGCVMVDYQAFEYAIDCIGGVEVTLTKKEAEYLNTTNYISNVRDRNVEEGTQRLNGAQTLGYCRVRDCPTINNEHNDFGRTERQRGVLQKIYKEMKQKNIIELVEIMNDCLQNSNIKTDITKEELKEYMTQVLELDVDSLNTCCIPSHTSYTNEKRRIGKKNQQVLVLKDINATKQKLQEIFYE